MIRRIFQSGEGQVLVTVDGDEVTVAARAHTWLDWSRPLPVAAVEDDPTDARPRYGHAGRTFPTSLPSG